MTNVRDKILICFITKEFPRFFKSIKMILILYFVQTFAGKRTALYLRGTTLLLDELLSRCTAWLDLELAFRSLRLDFS